MKLRIRHKLFITIFLTSSLVAGTLFFFLQFSFDRGFLNYVNNQEFKQLDILAKELANLYSDSDGWNGIKNNHFLWMNIQRKWFQEMHPKIDGPMRETGPPPELPPPPPVDPIQFARRITLMDVNKNRIMGGGPPEHEVEATTMPIERDGTTIGYIGLTPASEISGSGDLLFVKQQKTTFALVALMMLGISILLTFPVTIHLLRPINYLTEGTRKLIGGKFTTRIPVTSADELGILSDHFNMLAITLEENETARRRWIADISHELRTPLSVLRGEMEALLDGVRQMRPETLEPLHCEILHMQRLVGDLYELSMSDIGALTYRKVPVDVVGILTGALEFYEKRYAEKGLTLRLNLPKSSCRPLLGDPDRLQQLFTNLLENSLRYTDAPGTLEIFSEESQKAIILSFQDTGPGVTAEQLPLLFDRLYRTDPSRNRASSGAGLGLAICTNIAEAHQGKISSYPSPRGGVGIRIELPITA